MGNKEVQYIDGYGPKVPLDAYYDIDVLEKCNNYEYLDTKWKPVRDDSTGMWKFTSKDGEHTLTWKDVWVIKVAEGW